MATRAAHCGAPALVPPNSSHGVEAEQLGMRPDIRTIVRHVYRDIAHNANAQARAMRFQIAPLAKKLRLKEAMEFHIFGARLYRRIPGGPFDAAVGLLERHKSRELVQPVRTG